MVLTRAKTIALQALRAGPLAADEVSARWDNGDHAQALYSMARAGEWVVKVGDEYRITPAGRAACPFRNPLAATPAKPPEASPMLLQQIDILGEIRAAGADGITRKDLFARFFGEDRAVHNHLCRLTAGDEAPVIRARRGVYVAREALATEAPAVAEVTEAEVEKIAREYDEMIDFDLEEAQGVDVTAGHLASEEAGEMPDPVDRDAETIRKLQARKIVQLQEVVDNLLNALDASTSAKDAAQARVRELEGRLGANAAGAGAGVRYAVAFASDFHASIESAVAQAVRDYDEDSIKEAVVIACTPVGGIALRPVFVPAESA